MSQKQYHILEWLHALGVTLQLSTDTFSCVIPWMGGLTVDGRFKLVKILYSLVLK